MDRRKPKTDQNRKNKEIRELLSGLTRDQKKQWEGYSSHEKERILKLVEDRVERRMRFMDEPVRTSKAQKTEKAEPVYLRPEYSASRHFKTKPAGAGIKNRSAGKAEILEKTVTDRKTLTGSEKIAGSFDAGKTKMRPPVIKESAVHVPGRLKDRAEQTPGHRRGPPETTGTLLKETLDARRKEEKGKKKKAAVAEEEHPVKMQSQTGRGDRIMKQPIPLIGMAFKETGFDRAGEQKRQGFKDPVKHQKREDKNRSTLRKRLIKSEFTSLLSKDEKKRKNIRQMQRSQEISLSEMERSVGSDALRTAALPLRAKLSEMKTRAKAQLIKVAAVLLKYLIGFGGILFLLVFLFFFLTALFGTIAGQEQEGSGPYYSASGEEIVAYAKEWIGITRYIYGAGRASPTDWQDYADCSSFVHGVFNHFGIELGGDTYAMENNGTIMEGGLANAVPGDIILFYSGHIASGNSSHVGIYAGDGMMVHCSGNKSNNSAANAGRGVCMGSVTGDGRPYEVRRIVAEAYSGSGADPSDYSRSQLETIWAVVCQEDGGSYEGALAVISTAMNRVDSPQWSSLGRSAYEQLTAPGQFCYSIDDYWKKYLNGAVPDYVKQAVSDCLDRGIRNHTHTSFRSYYTPGSVQIGGGNYYFG